MLYAIIVAVLLVADQWLKYWVTLNLAVGTGTKALLPGVLSLSNIHNEGAAFGMLSDTPYAKWLFVAIAAVFVVIVIVVLTKKVFDSRFVSFCGAMAIAGALGNVIDRVINGYVVDMFKLEFMNFAIFNFADVCLVLAFLMFIVFLFVGEKVEDEEDEETEEPVKPKSSVKVTERAEAAEAIRSESISSDISELSEDEEFWNSLKTVTVKKPSSAPKTGTVTEIPALTVTPTAAPTVAPTASPTVTPKPAARVSKPEPKPESGEFDLESILAEFSDL